MVRRGDVPSNGVMKAMRKEFASVTPLRDGSVIVEATGGTVAIMRSEALIADIIFEEVNIDGVSFGISEGSNPHIRISYIRKGDHRLYQVVQPNPTSGFTDSEWSTIVRKTMKVLAQCDY